LGVKTNKFESVLFELKKDPNSWSRVDVASMMFILNIKPDEAKEILLKVLNDGINSYTCAAAGEKLIKLGVEVNQAKKKLFKVVKDSFSESDIYAAGFLLDIIIPEIEEHQTEFNELIFSNLDKVQSNSEDNIEKIKKELFEFIEKGKLSQKTYDELMELKGKSVSIPLDAQPQKGDVIYSKSTNSIEVVSGNDSSFVKTTTVYGSDMSIPTCRSGGRSLDDFRLIYSEHYTWLPIFSNHQFLEEKKAILIEEKQIEDLMVPQKEKRVFKDMQIIRILDKKFSDGEEISLVLCTKGEFFHVYYINQDGESKYLFRTKAQIEDWNLYAGGIASIVIKRGSKSEIKVYHTDSQGKTSPLFEGMNKKDHIKKEIIDLIVAEDGNAFIKVKEKSSLGTWLNVYYRKVDGSCQPLFISTDKIEEIYNMRLTKGGYGLIEVREGPDNNKGEGLNVYYLGKDVFGPLFEGDCRENLHRMKEIWLSESGYALLSEIDGAAYYVTNESKIIPLFEDDPVHKINKCNLSKRGDVFVDAIRGSGSYKYYISIEGAIKQLFEDNDTGVSDFYFFEDGSAIIEVMRDIFEPNKSYYEVYYIDNNGKIDESAVVTEASGVTKIGDCKVFEGETAFIVVREGEDKNDEDYRE
ncbi:MAG: hypothetical protein KAJ14_09660, partial [Candidatus Omnitrophica bacterium]|nr:hypothetical protein [Candidatus Omnitrophota bacterium]